MGQFSWLDCVDDQQILDNVARTSYVLVPKEFGGGHIAERCYDGYGHFGGYDIYDLVADWNKSFIDPYDFESEALHVPVQEDYAEERYYDSAVTRYDKAMQRLIDFCSGKYSDSQMKQKYGNDFKRLIGIDIACYDEDNAQLQYPIKITYDANAVYEQCDASLSDPNQGWGYAEPAEMVFIISCTLPEGATLNKSTVEQIVDNIFSDNDTGDPEVVIQNAEELRDWYEDDYEDNQFGVRIHVLVVDPDNSEYIVGRIYDEFKAAGYTVDDVYWDYD